MVLKHSVTTQPASPTRPLVRQALVTNTTGTYNTANGFQALINNTTGDFNTANGIDALLSNITGNFNTANGSRCARQQYNRHRQHGRWSYQALFNKQSTATATRPMVGLRSSATQAAPSTRPLALTRSKATQLGSANTATGFGAL